MNLNTPRTTRGALVYVVSVGEEGDLDWAGIVKEADDELVDGGGGAGRFSKPPKSVASLVPEVDASAESGVAEAAKPSVAGNVVVAERRGAFTFLCRTRFLGQRRRRACGGRGGLYLGADRVRQTRSGGCVDASVGGLFPVPRKIVEVYCSAFRRGQR